MLKQYASSLIIILSLVTSLPFCPSGNGAASTTAPAPVPKPIPPVDDLSLIPLPPYVPVAIANRPDVVLEAAPAPRLSPDISAWVSKTYPDGKYKAVLFSFDDSASGAAWTDHDLVLPLLKKDGLKAAFFLNYRADQVPGGIPYGHDASGKEIWTGDMSRDHAKELFRQLYGGMEIGNHTMNHYPPGLCGPDRIRHEIGDAKTLFETIFGQEVAGFAYPWWDKKKDNPVASGRWFRAYCKYIGIRYLRNGPLKWPDWAHVPSQLDVNIPADFYSWNPCLKYTDASARIDIVDAINWYIKLDTKNDMKVFFGVGHSWELVDSKTGQRNVNYSQLSKFCDAVAANSATLWNPTPIQFVDYINASRLVQVTKDAQGSITVHNPSKSVTVWLKIRGTDTPLAPGATIIK